MLLSYIYAIIIFLYIEHGYIMTAIAVLHKDEILKRVAKGDKISRMKIFECPLLAQSRHSQITILNPMQHHFIPY